MGCGSSKKIDNYNFDNTTNFSFNNKIFYARVVDIYDGDTCTCIFYFNDNYYKFKIRLANIDTCEIKSKDEENKKLANDAKNRLYTLITKNNDIITKQELKIKLNSNVYIVKLLCGEFDKYGRLLGWLFDKTTTNMNIDFSYNKILLNENLAYEYHGQTKLSEKEQINVLKKN